MFLRSETSKICQNINVKRCFFIWKYLVMLKMFNLIDIYYFIIIQLHF